MEGLILKRNIKFWLFQKVYKNQIKVGKKLNICDKMFEVENFEHLHLNTRVN